MAFRTPSGYAEYEAPYNESFKGERPSIHGLLPAPWLPVVALDGTHDNDPITIEAGTWVGRINATDHATAYAKMAAAKRQCYLAPACASTGEYTVTYSQYDIDASVPDLDGPTSAVAATGASTTTIEPVKPLGISFRNMYGSFLPDLYSGYKRSNMEGFLSYGYAVWLPVRTATEALIQIGDKVVIDNFSNSAGTWAPLSTSNAVGRMRAWASGDTPEFEVGKCIDKVTLGYQTSNSASQTFRAALRASNVTTSTVYNFGSLKRAQTVPGMYLQGSGTLGVPAWFGAATAQSQYWYGLLISVRCN